MRFIISKLRKMWFQFLCDHYWYSEIANQHSIVKFPARCIKCNKKEYVTGIKINEIKKNGK